MILKRFLFTYQINPMPQHRFLKKATDRSEEHFLNSLVNE